MPTLCNLELGAGESQRCAQGCLPMCYPLPKWVMGNGFWWMGGLPITLPIQVWVMGVTRPITHAYRCVDG